MRCPEIRSPSLLPRGFRGLKRVARGKEDARKRERERERILWGTQFPGVIDLVLRFHLCPSRVQVDSVFLSLRSTEGREGGRTRTGTGFRFSFGETLSRRYYDFHLTPRDFRPAPFAEGNQIRFICSVIRATPVFRRKGTRVYTSGCRRQSNSAASASDFADSFHGIKSLDLSSLKLLSRYR